MNTLLETDKDLVPPPLRVQLDEVCDRFEAACKAAVATMALRQSHPALAVVLCPLLFALVIP